MRTALEQRPLDRVRTTGEVLNDTLDFLRQHGRILLPTVLRLILPMFIVGQILLGLFSSRVAFLRERSNNPGTSDESLFTSGSENLDLFLMLAIVPLLFLAFCFSVAAGYAFLRTLEGRDVRLDGMPTIEEFKVEYDQLKATVVGTNLGLLLVGVAALLLYGFTVSIPLLGRFIGLAGMFLIPYFLVRFSLYYPARFIEEETLMGAFGRSSELVSGAWWRTFGLLVAATMLTWVFALAGLFPNYLLRYLIDLGVVPIYAENSALAIVVSLIGGVISGVISLIGMAIYLFIGVYFCSLREEREGGSLLAEMRLIGGGDHGEDRDDQNPSTEEWSALSGV